MHTHTHIKIYSRPVGVIACYCKLLRSFSFPLPPSLPLPSSLLSFLLPSLPPLLSFLPLPPSPPFFSPPSPLPPSPPPSPSPLFPSFLLLVSLPSLPPSLPPSPTPLLLYANFSLLSLSFPFFLSSPPSLPPFLLPSLRKRCSNFGSTRSSSTCMSCSSRPTAQTESLNRGGRKCIGVVFEVFVSNCVCVCVCVCVYIQCSYESLPAYHYVEAMSLPMKESWLTLGLRSLIFITSAHATRDQFIA